jgi:DNA excision repair protein ERCC-4
MRREFEVKVMNEREFLSNLTFLIDSREQAPFRFEGCRTIRVGLEAGDYSVAGLERVVAVERKSLEDLLACLTVGRERFERELMKARPYRFFAVVVERPLGDLLDGKYQSRMESEAALQSILAFSVRYRLPFFFCRNRHEAERVAWSLLRKAARECWKEFSGVVRMAESQNGGRSERAKASFNPKESGGRAPGEPDPVQGRRVFGYPPVLQR